MWVFFAEIMVMIDSMIVIKTNDTKKIKTGCVGIHAKKECDSLLFLLGSDVKDL